MQPYIEPDWPAPKNIVARSTTRVGGFSAAPYESFNLGHHVGDVDAAVAANRQKLLGDLRAATQLNWLSQVHGTRVVQAGQEGDCPEADAQWSREPGMACAVLSADCLPVLLCSVSGDVVAAAHAGWRGLLAGVLEATIAAMRVPPEQLMAWLGPAIGPSVFQVGSEVQEAFLSAANPQDRDAVASCFTADAHSEGRSHADIYTLARLRLGVSGVGVDSVYGGSACTVTDSKQFFSYRREIVTGRMASIITIASP